MATASNIALLKCLRQTIISTVEIVLYFSNSSYEKIYAAAQLKEYYFLHFSHASTSTLFPYTTLFRSIAGAPLFKIGHSIENLSCSNSDGTTGNELSLLCFRTETLCPLHLTVHC